MNEPPQGFTLLVAGCRGGKTSFLRLLLDTVPISPRATTDQIASVAKFIQSSSGHTPHIRSTSVELQFPSQASLKSRSEHEEYVTLTLIDTPSLDFRDTAASEWVLEETLRVIDDRFNDGLQQDHTPSSARTDPYIHLCIYFLDPDTILPPPLSFATDSTPHLQAPQSQGHAPIHLSPPLASSHHHPQLHRPVLLPQDIQVIKTLSQKVNVLPVIGKGDLMSNERLGAVKMAVRRDLADVGIGFGIFDNWSQSPPSAFEESRPSTSASPVDTKPKVNGLNGSGSSISPPIVQHPSSSASTPVSNQNSLSSPLLRLPYTLISPDIYSHSDGVIRTPLQRHELVQRYTPSLNPSSTPVVKSEHHSSSATSPHHTPPPAPPLSASPTPSPAINDKEHPITSPIRSPQPTPTIPNQSGSKFTRSYRWGTLDCLNPAHNDFLPLLDAIWAHMGRLRSYTADWLVARWIEAGNSEQRHRGFSHPLQQPSDRGHRRSRSASKLGLPQTLDPSDQSKHYEGNPNVHQSLPSLDGRPISRHSHSLPGTTGGSQPYMDVDIDPRSRSHSHPQLQSSRSSMMGLGSIQLPPPAPVDVAMTSTSTSTSTSSGGGNGNIGAKSMNPAASRLKKITVACNFCRSRKLKCDGGRPACGQCLKRSHSCDYQVGSKRRGSGTNQNQQSSSSTGNSINASHPHTPPVTIPRIVAQNHQSHPRLRRGTIGGQGDDSDEEIDQITNSDSGDEYYASSRAGMNRTGTGSSVPSLSPEVPLRGVGNGRDAPGSVSAPASRRSSGVGSVAGETSVSTLAQRQARDGPLNSNTYPTLPPLSDHSGGAKRDVTPNNHGRNVELPHIATLLPPPASPAPSPSISTSTSPTTSVLSASASGSRLSLSIPTSASVSSHSAGATPLPMSAPTNFSHGLGSKPRFRGRAGTGVGNTELLPPPFGEPGERKRSATMPSKSSGQLAGRLRPATGGPKVVACNHCRARKTKCDGTHPSCSSCIRRNLSCNYVHGETAAARKAAAQAQAQGRTSEASSSNSGSQAQRQPAVAATTPASMDHGNGATVSSKSLSSIMAVDHHAAETPAMDGRGEPTAMGSRFHTPQDYQPARRDHDYHKHLPSRASYPSSREREFDLSREKQNWNSTSTPPSLDRERGHDWDSDREREREMEDSSRPVKKMRIEMEVD